MSHDQPPAEIERKFLIDPDDLPDRLDDCPVADMEQGYLAIDGDSGREVRLRRRDDAWILTAKAGKGKVRGEAEIQISKAQFEELWPLTEGRRISKLRYTCELGDGHAAEIDVYRDDLRGLVTAEVEFDDTGDSDAFEPPAWFGDERTRDESLKNRQLAQAKTTPG